METVSVSQTGCHQKHYYCDGPDKDAKHEPKKEKTLGKPKPKIILENNWPVIFKNACIMKLKRQGWELYQIKIGLKVRIHNVTRDSEFPFVIKDYQEN